MGVKDNILEIIKRFEGISYNEIRMIYNTDYKTELDNKSGYVFIKRLIDKGFVISENDYVNRKKHYTYKPTLKAFNKEPQSLENPLHKILLRKMLKPFAEKGIKMVLEPIEVKEIKKLWSESNE